MSLASTTVFEVRPGAGSATNGGGFVPGSSGTDWSQQNAAQYSVTDGVLSGTTTVTSASANFGADVVGNVAYIAGSWYQIVSRTNATTIVVDRATGTATGQTIKIGGALNLCATAEPLLAAGMTLWIKSTGTQTLTSSLVTVNNGDATNGPITWAGYHTTRGDHDGTRPLITSSTSNVDLLRSSSSGTNYRIFDNLEWSSTAGTPGNAIATDTGAGGWTFLIFSNCYIHGVKNGLIADNVSYNSARQLWLLNTEISACTVDGLNISDITTLIGCYIHANGGYGLRVSNPSGVTIGTLGYPITCRDSVFHGNSLGGIYVLAASASGNTRAFMPDIDRCAIVSNTNDGIQIAAANGKLSIVSLQNSIIYGNSGYGVNITNVAATVVVNRNNAYGTNTSGARNNLATGTGDVTLTADPFVGRTTNDFTLNMTAGGGAACRAAGFPGAIPGLVAAGNSDIGTLQHGDPAASGGNVIIMPTRRRHYPVYVPMRRSVPSLALFAHPIVIRSPIRNMARATTVRRNAGHALFSQTVNQTVLVTSPRKVR